MTVIIEDGETIREITRLATGLSVSPDEVIRRAVHEKAARELAIPDRPSAEQFYAAVRELQELYASHRDPNDHRTDDEIIGYNEQGHFD